MSRSEDHVIYDRETRVDAIVTSIALLIDRGGLGAVTMRSVAAETRMAHSGIAYDLTNRDRMLVVAADRFGRRLLRVRSDVDGAEALLPAVDSDLLPTRVWLAFRELALSSPDVATVVAAIDDDERQFLLNVSPAATTEDQIESTLTLLLGLRAALCRTVSPVSIPRAHVMLDEHISGHGLSQVAA